MRIAIIHALRHSAPPIEAAFARLWPEARLMNLIDDSLSADLARDGRLTEDMTRRFLTLARYAASTGAQGILFSCSAFGPPIETCARDLAPMPVLKPNEAMIEEAVKHGSRIGLLATLVPKLAEGALAALDRGDAAKHGRLAAEAARALADCDAIALGQFSLARAAPLVAQVTGKPVLTTPESAVRKLKALLAA